MVWTKETKICVYCTHLHDSIFFKSITTRDAYFAVAEQLRTATSLRLHRGHDTFDASPSGEDLNEQVVICEAPSLALLDKTTLTKSVGSSVVRTMKSEVDKGKKIIPNAREGE